jgi:putative methionine-R-sulfoxide reductase with GAF domain
LAIAGYVTQVSQLYAWAGLTLALNLSTTAAWWIVRSGQLNWGAFAFAGGVLVTTSLYPLFMSGLLSLVLLGNVVPIILIGLFASPHLILRMTGIAFIASFIAALLELWSPLGPADVSILGIFFALVGFVFVGALLHLFGQTLGRLLAASQDYAHKLEQSQADLIARTQELQATTADLAAQGEALQKTGRELEEIARQSQRRASTLQAIIEVGHTITQIRDPSQLLSDVTRLISQYFGFYHVGIFIIDEAGRYAVLRAANSTGGQRMLTRRHRLAVGIEGIVGRVASTGRPRVALDVGTDAVYFDNPDLPDTRSEMALPLHAGNMVVGVLDVQSTEERAFDDQDISVLTALSEQVAVAMENARLFRESQAALARAEEAYRHYVRQEWDSFLRPDHRRPSTSGAPRSTTRDAARISEET